MKFFSVRLSCPSEEMNDSNKNFFSLYEACENQSSLNIKLTRIPYCLEELETNDYIFVHLGGDAARLGRYFRNSGISFGHTGWHGVLCNNTSYPTNQEIKGTFYPFSNSVHKEFLLNYPQFINNLGLSSKSEQNQAGLYKLNEVQGLGFIEFLKIKGFIGLAETETDQLLTNDKLRIGKNNYDIINSDLVFKQSSSADTVVNEFNVNEFENSLNASGLIFDKKFLIRFLSSLCAKPFVLLTGLSGSGKTKLAVSFAKWICKNNINNFQLLKEALESETIKSNYELCHISEKTVELINTSGSSGGIIPLPTKAIYETYEALIAGKFSEDDNPKDVIRDSVGVNSVYQKHIFGHYTEFHKIAVAMSKIDKVVDESALKQYEVISVGPDWTNREHLLGYTNALDDKKYVKPENGALDLLIRANENPDLPFFLILDEMNLSHVERYFADYLSTMESEERISLHTGGIEEVPPNIFLPKNFFIIGTVNIDETTYMFSPKVLDRANVLEFRVRGKNMEDYFENYSDIDMEMLEGEGASMAESFLASAKEKGLRDETVKDNLMPFFTELEKVGAEFGYRTASEISRFVKICADMGEGVIDRDEVIDAAIIQKLLPKLHGSRKKLETIIEALMKLCMESAADNDATVKYHLSYEKLGRMLNRVQETGFTSFAEN